MANYNASTMASKFEELVNRSKDLYGKMLSKEFDGSLEYISGDDFELIKEGTSIMNEMLDLSVELMKENARLAGEVCECRRLAADNNRLLRRLVYSKREV